MPYDGTRPLRIALITSSYNYIKDGVALTLNRMVAYMESQGVEVLVFAPTAPKQAFAHSGTMIAVPSMALPMRPEYRLAFGMPHAIRRQLAAFQPDIIHIAVPDLLGYRALKLAQKWGVPVIASYHTRYETYLKYYWFLAGFTGLVTRYLRSFYAACREVYVPSASAAEALLADGLKNNFRLWPRGIDAQRFHPGKRSDAWRARHGIGPNDLVIAHISRLVREKQLDVMIDILRRFESHGLAHKVLIVGEGPERAMLEAALPRAIFTGFLDGEELATAYASSDLFLFVSDTESFGNVTLEAMASGLPCICANATGSRSLVAPGVTGFLAEPKDVARYVEHLVALAGDDGLRHRMGAAARSRALSFSWDETMALLLGYYKALLLAEAEVPAKQP